MNVVKEQYHLVHHKCDRYYDNNVCAVILATVIESCSFNIVPPVVISHVHLDSAAVGHTLTFSLQLRCINMNQAPTAAHSSHSAKAEKHSLSEGRGRAQHWLCQSQTPPLSFYHGNLLIKVWMFAEDRK